MQVGQTVYYEGKAYEVLGFAASRDENDECLIEIAWNNYNISASGYLAVPRKDLFWTEYEYFVTIRNKHERY